MKISIIDTINIIPENFDFLTIKNIKNYTEQNFVNYEHDFLTINNITILTLYNMNYYNLIHKIEFSLENELFFIIQIFRENIIYITFYLNNNNINKLKEELNKKLIDVQTFIGNEINDFIDDDVKYKIYGDSILNIKYYRIIISGNISDVLENFILKLILILDILIVILY